MNGKIFFIFLLAAVAAGCKPTYHKETIKESVRDLAKKEYGLDVEVEEAGRTLGLRFRVNNLFGELVAEDQRIWKQVDDLMLVLSRVTLSTDEPPEFFVLDIVDQEHSGARLVFTRYVQDIKKFMAEGLSRNQYVDRLLMEFVINGKRILFDPYEMDIVRLMMMTMEANESKEDAAEPVLEEVKFQEFIANVASNYMRRLLRDKKDMQKHFQVRQVTAAFTQDVEKPRTFKVFLDMVSLPSAPITPNLMELKVLPFVADQVTDIFRSYKFRDFKAITVVEKNSGKILTVSR